MPRLFALTWLLLLVLTGCGQDLHFKISYDKIDGLAEGAPVVLDDQPIGKVTGVEQTKSGGHLVEVSIPRESAGAATSEASFILADDPDKPQQKRIEVVLAGPGGKPIAEGAEVRGSYPSPIGGIFPFGELLREIGGVLGQLRGQVERFRQEFQKLPDSPEAKQLQEEWRKLMDEIDKTQNEAGYAMKKEILPKLEKEMDALRKRMEEMQKAEPKKGKDLET
jgi:hypothetical protein